MTKSDSSTASDRPKRYFPPRWVLAIMLLCVLIIAGVQAALHFVDNAPEGPLGFLVLMFGEQAVANITRFVCLVGIVFWPTAWFIFGSSYWLPLRAMTFVLIVCGVGGFFAMYEIDQVDGDLVPHFKERGKKAAHELLAIPDEAEQPAVEVALASTTEYDFPRFLGPGGDLIVDNVQLADDWDAQPPELVWRQPIGAGWSAFAVVNGQAVTLEQRGPKELVTCYDVKSGDLLWLDALGVAHTDDPMGGEGPRSTPTIFEGKVYALGATGVLRCIDGATGERLWSKDIPEMFGVTTHEQDRTVVSWGRSASPLVFDDLVVVPGGGSGEGEITSLVALDRETGEKRWEAGTWQISYASPVLTEIAGVRQILSVNEGMLSAHDPQDGKVLWTAEWPSSSSSEAAASQPVVLPGDRVLLTKGYRQGGKLLQITNEKGDWQVEVLWENNNVLKTKFTNVVVKDGYVYGLSDGILECVELETGDRQWKNSRGRYGHGQLLLVGDVILVQAESGEVVLAAATPDRLKELGRFPALEGQTWNNLCLYNDLLLVRNATEAACYRLPLAGASAEQDPQDEPKDAENQDDGETPEKGEEAQEDSGQADAT
ncbi:MAG: PQQ-binding-like beta-propeller repeat protein [Pirellulaceae bacterium]